MIHTTTMAIIKAFANHFCNKFQSIQIDEDSARQLLNCDLKEVTNETNTSLEQPITMNELWITIVKGKPHKAPGHDGIGLQFCKRAWEIIKTELLQIVNRMHIEGMTMVRELQGLIVCIPKHSHPTDFDDYRPLTLMNTDYKIMRRIIATRLKPYLTEILHQNQFCGVQGNTVFETVTAIRDVIAHAEVTKKPLFVVSIDFSAAFDRISHEYLRKVLATPSFNE